MLQPKSLDFTGYPGYEIFPSGEIKNSRSGVTLKGWVDHNGYHQLELSKAGKGKSFLRHVLVAKAFLPNPLNLPEVNHLKGKDFNSVEDLEWCTTLKNQRHSIENSLNGAKLSEEACKDIAENASPRGAGGKFSFTHFSEKYQVDITTISDVYYGKAYSVWRSNA